MEIASHGSEASHMCKVGKPCQVNDELPVVCRQITEVKDVDVSAEKNASPGQDLNVAYHEQYLDLDLSCDTTQYK